VAAVHLVGCDAQSFPHDSAHELGGEETIIATQQELGRHVGPRIERPWLFALTVNPGLASVKLAVVEDGVAVDRTAVEAASVECARGLLGELAARWHPIDAVGVRFVRGGERAEPVLLDQVESRG
jgi:hypothetical protein